MTLLSTGIMLTGCNTVSAEMNENPTVETKPEDDVVVESNPSTSTNFNFSNNYITTTYNVKTYYTSSSVTKIDFSDIVYTDYTGTYTNDKTKTLLNSNELVYSNGSTLFDYNIDTLVNTLKTVQSVGSVFYISGYKYTVTQSSSSSLSVSKNGIPITFTNGSLGYTYKLYSTEEYKQLEVLNGAGKFVINDAYAFNITSNNKSLLDAYVSNGSYAVLGTNSFVYKEDGVYSQVSNNNFTYDNDSNEEYLQLNEFTNYINKIVNDEIDYFIYENCIFKWHSESLSQLVISYCVDFEVYHLTVTNDFYDYSIV